MLIATDGACKRNGKPDCTSVGVAWIQTDDGNLLFKSKFETESTSQRGEINGLIEALTYAVETAKQDEYIIIITDSQYLMNTVSLGWCFKWRQNGWKNADGNDTKNADLWAGICVLLDTLNVLEERVFIEWTKGHMVHYTPGDAKKSMIVDPSGVELYQRITSKANRVADKDNIIDRFLNERREHDKTLPPRNVALEWAIANATADCLAFYIVNLFDAAYMKENE